MTARRPDRFFSSKRIQELDAQIRPIPKPPSTGLISRARSAVSRLRSNR